MIKNAINILGVCYGLGALLLFGCDNRDDDTLRPSDISSIMIGEVSLNELEIPNNVSTEATSINVNYNQSIDGATIGEENIQLIRRFDEASIPLNISADGSNLVITISDPLGEGTAYQVNIEGLKGSNGQNFAPETRFFTTEGTFVPPGQVAYWNFDNNADDQVGGFDPAPNDVISITYGAARKSDFGQAAQFDGDASIIEIPNADQLITSESFTMSMWVKTISDGHVNANGDPAGHFLLGAGAIRGMFIEIAGGASFFKKFTLFEFEGGNKGNAGDLFFNGDGRDNTNGGWQGTNFNTDLTSRGGVSALLEGRWAHIVFQYDHETKTRKFFIDGALVISQNFNLWPEDSDVRNVTSLAFDNVDDVENKLAFGFAHSRGGTLWDTEPWGNYDVPTSNHFKGELDDIRVFQRALSDLEIRLLFQAEQI